MKRRGFIVSFEMMLIIFAVLGLVATVLFTMYKHELAQASSAKETATITSATVWEITYASLDGVSVGIQNMGSDTLQVTRIEIVWTDRTGGERSCGTDVNTEVNAGELKIVSATISADRCGLPEVPPAGTPVFVKVYMRGKSEFTIGIATKVVKPE